MPKVIMTFKIPEEQEELKLAQKGNHYYYAIHEFDMWLRNMFKYEDKEVVNIEEARKKLYDLLRDDE